MAPTTRLLIVALLLICSALAPVRSRGADAQSAGPLVVIIARSTGLTDIKSAALRSAFQGYPAEYKGGMRLIPFNLPAGTAERTQFDRDLLGLEPSEVGRFWIDKRIRAEGRPPRAVPSAEVALRVVIGFPGAIAYVAVKPSNPNVQVLTIDGNRFSDPGYIFSKH